MCPSSNDTHNVTEFISATADIRGDYRYTLTRVWDAALPAVTFVLLNPSTADAVQLDPTLRKCVGYAKREGFGSMIVANVYAYRTKNPAAMRTVTDPIGPENDDVLASLKGPVIAGWGVNADPTRIARVRELLPPLHALAVTKNGHPGHPLYLRKDAQMAPWGR